MKKKDYSQEQVEIATLAKALGHPARVAILDYLASVGTCICGDIVNELPLAQPTVSQHLKELKNAGLRAISDLRNEKIGFKIREKTLERIPYMLVLGDKEVESGSVNVRTREGENLGVMSVAEFIELVQTAVAEKGRQNQKTDQE